DLCLACLDQVTTWLDQIQAAGEVPRDAHARAGEIARQFRLVSEASRAGALEAIPPRREEASPDPGVPSRGLPPTALAVLEEQAKLLRTTSAGQSGRWQSAVRVA